MSVCVHIMKATLSTATGNSDIYIILFSKWHYQRIADKSKIMTLNDKINV